MSDAPQESAYPTMLKALAVKKNWGETETKLFDVWRNRVAEFESQGIEDAVQEGGPGRGMYQYELSKGGSGANKTAITRLNNFIKQFKLEVSIPTKDQEILKSDDPDFSKLTSDTQSAIFLADKYYDPSTNLSDLTNPSKFQQESYRQWREGHWKGDEQEAPKKEKRWNQMYSSTMPSTIQGKT